ncbi:VanZ family protein [Azospira restricta]|uniref:VanZ family protein n=1 Tax=Azospira restricta TaxID=404405 RepID=A0A974Y456_9RHOO|nr:VanZ family protein [Azospira restricta]QRJ64275.1 VanZ family protein [Azospira restricta]
MTPATTSLLPRYLALAYTALVVYASLHPFAGWRDLGISPLAFLDAGWPRWWTGFDLATNVLVYVPLGYLLTLALGRQTGRLLPALAGALLAALISFCLEAVQTWLPTRVPSNLDFSCNALGGAIGAIAAWRGGNRALTWLARVERRIVAPVPHAEFGLVVLGLWLLTQLSPETLLFGAGDFRQLLGLAPAIAYGAPTFFALELAIIACNTVAIGLIARTLLASRPSPLAVLLAFFLFALLLRALSAALLVGPREAMAWLTPGAGLGLAIGGALLLLCLLTPPAWRVALAGLALMAGTVLVNLAPANPYSVAALATWWQGHFLNFNGLTRLVASLWPFLALPYLLLLGRRL